MLLYHFTSRENLRSIMQSGLSRGAVHLSADQRLPAVWLTTDGSAKGHGLDSGGAFMTDEERIQAREWSGRIPPPGERFPKPAEVRIAVEIEVGDRLLHDWLPWARRHIDAEWLAQLHPVASGDLKKARNWRLYFGVILTEAFVAVEELGACPTVVPLRPEVRLAS